MLNKGKVDIRGITSERKGSWGAVETFMRSFRNLFFLLLLLTVAIYCIMCLGVAIYPSVLIFNYFSGLAGGVPPWFGALIISCSLGLSYVIYGFSVVLVVPIFNLPVLPFVKPMRGNWFSLETVPWFIHNALTYIARYTFLDLLTPSPLNILFFKMMGMKIGKGVMINSSNISDPCLIQLGDYVLIGGSAHLLAHYGQKGFLVISRTVIKKGVTIGLKASIMGGVEIGERVIIPPHHVVFPKTVIPDDHRFKTKEN